jgi:hypothetical protein
LELSSHCNEGTEGHARLASRGHLLEFTNPLDCEIKSDLCPNGTYFGDFPDGEARKFLITNEGG